MACSSLVCTPFPQEIFFFLFYALLCDAVYNFLIKFICSGFDALISVGGKNSFLTKNKALQCGAAQTKQQWEWIHQDAGFLIYIFMSAEWVVSGRLPLWQMFEFKLLAPFYIVALGEQTSGWKRRGWRVTLNPGYLHTFSIRKSPREFSKGARVK